MLLEDRDLFLELLDKEIRHVRIDLQGNIELKDMFSADMESSFERFQRISPPLKAAYDEAAQLVRTLTLRLDQLTQAKARL